MTLQLTYTPLKPSSPQTAGFSGTAGDILRNSDPRPRPQLRSHLQQDLVLLYYESACLCAGQRGGYGLPETKRLAAALPRTPCVFHTAHLCAPSAPFTLCHTILSVLCCSTAPVACAQC